MATLSNPVQWLVDFFRGSGSGATVNPTTVTGIPAVWYAINKISNNFSQLPFQPMARMEPKGARPAVEHRAYRPTKKRSNNYMNAGVFRQKIITDALLWGDGRAVIVDGGREYLPLNPACSLTFLVEGEKYHATAPHMDDRIVQFASNAPTLDDQASILREYFVLNPDKTIVLPDRQVLHLMGFTLNGVCGVSIVEIAKQTFETSLNSRKHLNKQWQKGFTGRLMLEAPQGAFRSEQDAAEFLKNFKQAHTLDGDNETVGLLRENVKANVLTMSGRDAQWTEQVADSRRDVALLFLLESILGDDQSVSYNSLAEKNLAFLVNCLANWLKKWEEECDEKLLSESEKRRDSHFFKFNTAALLRTDIKTTMETLALGVNTRIFSPNDAREKLDENPYDGGDIYVNPAIDTIETTQQPDPAQARLAVLSRVKHMIGVESSRVKRAATSAKNYLDWLDDFYAGWVGKLTEVVEELGGNTSVAAAYCDESRQLLVSATGGVTQDALPEAIEQVVSNWDQRAEEITDQILGKG